MELSFLFKGLILGFSVAATFGPIGVLCVRRTLSHGPLAGFVSGLGAATADLVYGIVAAFGFGALSSILISQEKVLHGIGGGFLLYLGVKILFAKASTSHNVDKAHSLREDYFSVLFLMFTNPGPILFFLAVFAGLGLTNAAENYLSSFLIIFGVSVGSTLWWVILSGATHFLRSRLTPKILQGINVAAGLIIIGFAVSAFAQAIK